MPWGRPSSSPAGARCVLAVVVAAAVHAGRAVGVAALAHVAVVVVIVYSVVIVVVVEVFA